MSLFTLRTEKKICGTYSGYLCSSTTFQMEHIQMGNRGVFAAIIQTLGASND